MSSLRSSYSLGEINNYLYVLEDFRRFSPQLDDAGVSASVPRSVLTVAITLLYTMLCSDEKSRIEHQLNSLGNQ